jgi:hypothetical protein
MGYQHLLALVIFMCILYFICRFGFGWIPGTPNSPSATIHLRGITDDGGTIMDQPITDLVQFEDVRHQQLPSKTWPD